MLDQVVAPLLFGLAANTDNLTIGIAYGMKRRWFGWQQNLLIAVGTTLVTLAAMALGRQIRQILPPRLPDILGGVLLLVFALWNVWRERTAPPNRPAVPGGGYAGGGRVGMGESLFLAGALSINNIGLAIAGGIGGVGYLAATGSIFCFSLGMLAIGQAAGGDFIRAWWVPRLLRDPAGGNAMLALAGVLMLAGY